MQSAMGIAADLVAVSVLVLLVYRPRHRRQDLVTAFLVINVGVLAVTVVLESASSSGAGIGVGIGLFGILSIIRVRSSELDHVQIAYFFTALSLGVLGAVGGVPIEVRVSLMATIVAVMALADGSRLIRGHETMQVQLDRAYTDERGLRTRLEEVLGGRVHRATVISLDLVKDACLAEVRLVPVARPRRRWGWRRRRSEAVRRRDVARPAARFRRRRPPQGGSREIDIRDPADAPTSRARHALPLPPVQPNTTPPGEAPASPADSWPAPGARLGLPGWPVPPRDR